MYSRTLLRFPFQVVGCSSEGLFINWFLMLFKVDKKKVKNWSILDKGQKIRDLPKAKTRLLEGNQQVLDLLSN